MIELEPAANSLLQCRRNNGLTNGVSFNAAAALLMNGLPGRIGAGVRFSDVNGDGLTDYMFVDRVGNTAVPYNTGPAIPATWRTPFSLTLFTAVAGSMDRVVVGDINGDGLAGYINVSRTDGNITVALWTGKPQKLGPAVSIAPNVVTIGSNIQFVDMNGDRRIDMVAVDPVTSAVRSWVSQCKATTWEL